ncbi:MAG: YihY/virulence factor BrkB family protein [Oscillibacter sp.]|jgi:membrane protein|nr:YihY/virulence factor BrkB family protein [Oscillibacter sp.]
MEDPELKPLPENRAMRGVYLMIRRYLNHNVAIQSAALAFYLLFTIFPLLIFLNALLGLLHVDLADLLTETYRILPDNVVSFIESYLNYVGRTSSLRLLWFGLFFSVYFPMRATNTLMRAVRTAYHLGPPRGPFRHTLKTLLYTVFLIVSLTVLLVLLTVGNIALNYAIVNLGLPAKAAEIWSRLRFPLATVLMYFALYLLYAMTQDTRQPQRNLYPGALASLIGWLIASVFFTLYMEKLADYSLLYGSIGTVIALLVWLYLSATVLIMGAEFNGTLISLRRERAESAAHKIQDLSR